jgi:transmembrane sensor
MKDGGQSAAALTPVQRQALDWVSRMVSGEATNADIAAMHHWRDQDPDNAAALTVVTRLVKYAESQDLPRYEHLKAPLLARPATRRFALGGLMAACAVYGVIRPPLEAWPSLAELASDYRTKTGQQRNIALASNLSLQLNTATSVSLRNTPGRPGISLINGEVAVSAQLPSSERFTTYLRDGEVQARDALFTVRLTDTGFHTTCMRGSVTAVQRGGQVQLSSGYAVACIYGAAAPGTPYKVDATMTTAWRNGQLIFYNAPLSDVVAEINRYRHGEIVVLNGKLANRRLNASFWIDRLDGMADHLAKFTGASATTLPGGIILLS